MITLKLIDSMTNKQFEINSHKNKINFYCCGITAQSEMHIGHVRTFIVFDVLVRFLKLKHHNVIFCSNITDIDHKITKKINQITNENNIKNEIFYNFVNKQCETYLDQRKNLNLLEPTHLIRVTQSIKYIILYIEKLIHNNCAYEKNGFVYFSVVKYFEFFNCYPECVKFENHLDDFLLWIKGSESDITFESPWSKGYPAWHITCSVINNLIFNDDIDLHGGGNDLIYPHHFCECLQSNCFSKKKNVFKNFMHVAFVTRNGVKMTKSIENCLHLSDFKKNHTTNETRIMFLLNYYKNDIDETELLNNLNYAKTFISKINDIENKINNFNENFNENNDVNIEDDYNNLLLNLTNFFHTELFIEETSKYVEKYINVFNSLNTTNVEILKKTINNIKYVIGIV